MGVKGFGSDNDEEARKMDRRLRAAQSKDRKRLKVGDCKKKLIQAAVSGDSDVQMHSVYQDEMLKWVGVIRQRFSGITIRRNLHSLDNTGARISGLGPLYEHHLLVKLYPHEIDNLEALAKELVEDGAQRAAKAAATSVRSVLTFPHSSMFTDCSTGLLYSSSQSIATSQLRDTLSVVKSFHR
jgi:hypothetical protein